VSDATDVLGEIGTAISVAHTAPERGAGRLQVLAATGVGKVLTPGHHRVPLGAVIAGGGG
jgi:hypothetical protein